MRKAAVILATGTAVVALILLSTRLVTSSPDDAGPSPSTSRTTPAATADVRLKSPGTSEGSGSGLSSEPPVQPLAMNEAGNAASPIPIPYEFDLVSPDKIYWHNDRWRELHARLEHEPFDPSWTSAAEEAVRSAVTSNPEITSRGNPTVNCRTTLCEVQMVVHGGDAKDAQWHTFFNPVLKELLNDGFKYEDISTAREGTAMTIVFFVSRGAGQK